MINNYYLKNNTLSYYILITSFMFLIFIGSIFIGNSLLFICGLSINKFSIIIFPILSLILSKVILNKDGEKIKWRYMIGILFLFYILIFILGVVNNFIWDSSYDSLAYHQEGIIKLKNRWNPFYNAKESSNIWVQHYTKSPWIFAASIYIFTGKIETAKVLTSLLPIIIFTVGFSFLYLVTKRKMSLSILGALLLAINPININQFFTFYVDSLLGIYIILLIIILFLILFYKDLFYFKYFVLINIATFLVNIKFTGLAYASVILIIFVICNLLYNSKKYNIKLILFLIISFFFSIIIIGFNPYVTNTINNGNPLFPLSGKYKVDIMTPNTPEEFRNDSELEKAIKSLIATPSINNTSGKLPNSLLEMFKINEDTKKLYSTVDPRLRGFGVYSVIFLPLSFIFLIYLISKCKHKKIRNCSILLLIGLAFTIIYCGDFWWARYISFIWFIPIITYVIMSIMKRRLTKLIGFGLIIIMIINSTIMIPTTFQTKIKLSNDLKKQILTDKNIKNDIFVFSKINKAKEFHISYKLID